MLQPPPFPSSPAGSNFTPRKEFTETPPRQSSNFALLAFSSNNAIRLSNFPQPLVTALRSLLNTVIGLRSFRENAEHKLAEIILTGKPWSRSKSLSTEIILVQVFNVLLAHDYNIVSQIDYGREHNDRLSLAFSTPVSTPGDPEPAHPRLVSFALSFPSPTILRVVCPPLHATPAILQSIRGAWPLGVKSEKKLGEGCYEFKLKGYSWFSEDTFCDDALAHTLTILTALDRQGCKLLTSLALAASHARNKDLWLFSAPGPGVAAPTNAGADMMLESPVRLGSPLKPSTYEPIVDHTAEGSGSGDSEGRGTPESRNSKTHIRGATVDGGLSGHVIRDGHARSPSDPAAVTVRKKNPVASDEPTYPAPSHDIIPGPPPEAIYTSSLPRGQTNTIHVSDLPAHQPAQSSPEPFGVPRAHPLVSLPEATEQHLTGEDFPPHEAQGEVDPHPSNRSTPTVHAPDLPTPPLLPPAAFRTPLDEPRDSGFSLASGHSFDVPITWIPAAQPPPSAFLNVDTRTETDRSSITTGPLPPGGWTATPAVEADDSIAREGASKAAGGTRSSTHSTVMPEKQDTIAPQSPEIVHPPQFGQDGEGQAAPRKSEAGSLGVIPSPAREDAPPMPKANGDAGAAPEDAEKPKEGWVMVSIAPGESAPTAASPPEQAAPAPDPAVQARTTHVPVAASQLIAAADATEASSPSPVASTPEPTSETKSHSSLGRFFSRSNRKEGGIKKLRSVEKEADTEKEKGGRFRRKGGGALPTLRSGKRGTID